MLDKLEVIAENEQPSRITDPSPSAAFGESNIIVAATCKKFRQGIIFYNSFSIKCPLTFLFKIITVKFELMPVDRYI